MAQTLEQDTVATSLTSSALFKGRRFSKYGDLEAIERRLIYRTINESDPITVIYQPTPELVDLCNRFNHPTLMIMKMFVLYDDTLVGVTNIKTKPGVLTLRHFVENKMTRTEDYPWETKVRHIHQLIDLCNLFYINRIDVFMDSENIVYQEGTMDGDIIFVPNNILYKWDVESQKAAISGIGYIICEIFGLPKGTSAGIIEGLVNPDKPGQYEKYSSGVDDRILSLLFRLKDLSIPADLLNDSMFEGLPQLSSKAIFPSVKAPTNVKVFYDKLVGMVNYVKKTMDEESTEILFMMIDMFYRMPELVIVNDNEHVVKALIAIVRYFTDKYEVEWSGLDFTIRQYAIAIMEELKYNLFSNPFFAFANDMNQLTTVYKKAVFNVDTYTKVSIRKWYSMMPKNDDPQYSKYLSIDEFFNVEV